MIDSFVFASQSLPPLTCVCPCHVFVCCFLIVYFCICVPFLPLLWCLPFRMFPPLLLLLFFNFFPLTWYFFSSSRDLCVLLAAALYTKPQPKRYKSNLNLKKRVDAYKELNKNAAPYTEPQPKRYAPELNCTHTQIHTQSRSMKPT